ncbi:MAG TPA: fumarylacetoacetate hydrolase family protein [Candidatus Limnocylindrales bacterium]
MRLAHVRERRAPAGSPWRLAAALDPMAASWLDIEVARRRAVAARPSLAHDSQLHRQPVTTLDDHLSRGLRVEALADLVEGFSPRDGEDSAILDADDVDFGLPVLRPPSFRDFYAFEGHVGTIWQRRGQEIPEAWYRLPIFYFSNTSELRGPGEAVWAPRGSEELDYELEVGVLVDTAVRDLSPARGEEAIGGYFVLNDWSARDLQREETAVRLGPAKGKDFATSMGPWLVTPDELADRRTAGATAPDLVMTATVRTADGQVVETSRGMLSSAHHALGAMVARASADVRLRPGDVIGSGTVGGGSLLEIREATLGRYLQPGDEVTLEVERLGRLVTPVVARPDHRPDHRPNRPERGAPARGGR